MNINERIKKNKVAADKLLAFCINTGHKTLRDLFKNASPMDKNGYSSTLRMCGLSCIECGSDISWPILQWFHFEVDKVLCYECQDKKKSNNL